MKNFFLRPLPFLIVLILSIVFFTSLHRSGKKNELITQSLDKLDSNIVSLETDVENIEKDLYIATSSTEKERRMREELLLQKPGEIVFILSNENKETEKKSENTITTPTEMWKEVLLF